MSKRMQSGSVEGATNTRAEDAAIASSKISASRGAGGAASIDASDTANDVTRYGIESVPDLIAALRREHRSSSFAAVKDLVKIGGEAVPALVEAMKDDDTRPFAAITLRRLRKDAAFAVPGLIEQLRNGGDGGAKRHAADVLSVLGPVSKDAVSALVTSLENDELEVRCIAAEALGRIGKTAHAAGPVLLATTRFGDPALRAKAALALGQVGAATADIVPDLIELLRCGDWDVRSTAARAVGNLGAAATIPALISAIKNTDGGFCCSAIEALGKFGPDAKDGVPVLAEAVMDETYEIASCAIETLSKIGQDAKDAVPALATALEHEELAVCSSAAELLGSLGADAKDAVPALIEAMNAEDEEDVWYRCKPIKALGKIGPDARAVVPILVELLSDNEVEVRWAVANTLGAIGPDSVDAVPKLVRMLEDSVVRNCVSREPVLLRTEDDIDQTKEPLDHEATDCGYTAALALGRIGPGAKAGVPSLILALKDDDCDVRAQVVWALGRIGPVTDRVIPALIEALHDEDCDVHEGASRALAEVGVEATTETVPLLLSVTPRNDDSLAQYFAFEALRRIGLPAVPGLIEALKNPSRETRQLAAGTLADIGSSASDAVPALTKALEDEDAELRESAEYALKEINTTKPATH